jgi:hypothetical protein
VASAVDLSAALGSMSEAPKTHSNPYSGKRTLRAVSQVALLNFRVGRDPFGTAKRAGTDPRVGDYTFQALCLRAPADGLRVAPWDAFCSPKNVPSALFY